jgi:hypothetical protein
VNATAAAIEGDSIRTGPDGLGRPKPPGSGLLLEFDWKGQKQSVGGVLEGRTEFIRVGELVPIRVNPDDPNDWTARRVNAPLLPHLAGGLVPIVLALPVFLVSFMKRRGLLRTWRDGSVAEATVVSHSQTAIAPRSRVVRCALQGADRQIQSVYVPATKLPPGSEVESIQVLVPTSGGRTLATAWFV